MEANAIAYTLEQCYSGSSNASPLEAKEVLDNFANNPEFYSILFNIIRSRDYSFNVRQMAIIQLKIQILQRWPTNIFPQDFKIILFSNFPNLILNIEPVFNNIISNLTKAFLKVSFNEFSQQWLTVISKFFEVSEEPSFFAGLLILMGILSAVKKISSIINGENQNEFFNITEFCLNASCAVTQGFVNYSLDTKCWCLSVYGRIINMLFKKKCFEVPEIATWLDSVNILQQDLPLDITTCRFIGELLQLFNKIAFVIRDQKFAQIACLLDCSNVLIIKKWENDINISLVEHFFHCLKTVSETETWIFFQDRVPNLIQNAFIPFFQLNNEAILMSVNNPTQFILDYHIERDGCESPTGFAYSALRAISCRTELQPMLFEIAFSSFQSYQQNRNSAALYSAFHMVSSCWHNLLIQDPMTINDFVLQVISDSEIQDGRCDTLAKAAVLIVISQMCPYKSKPFSVNPVFIDFAARCLYSESTLERYFATNAIYSIFENLSAEGLQDDVKNICILYAPKIIELVFEYAHEIDCIQITNLISIFVKNSEILNSIIEKAPEMISTAFGLALSVDQNLSNFYVLLNTLINLINQLESPPELDKVCLMTFNSCIETFNSLKAQSVIYELINMIILKSPTYHAEYNKIFDILCEVCFADDCMHTYTTMCIFHNMIIRSPSLLALRPSHITSIVKEILDHNYFEYATIFFPILMKMDRHFSEEIYEQTLSMLKEEDIQNFLYPTQINNYGYLFTQLMKINPGDVLLNCSDNFQMFVQLSPPIFLAYAMVYIGELLPTDDKNTCLTQIIETEPDKIILPDDDPDEAEFEQDTNSVDIHTLPVISAEEMLLEFINYLRYLLIKEKDLSIFGNSKLQENLGMYLNLPL